mgnify:CR=1 FL=1
MDCDVGAEISLWRKSDIGLVQALPKEALGRSSVMSDVYSHCEVQIDTISHEEPLLDVRAERQECRVILELRERYFESHLYGFRIEASLVFGDGLKPIFEKMETMNVEGAMKYLEGESFFKAVSPELVHKA